MWSLVAASYLDIADNFYAVEIVKRGDNQFKIVVHGGAVIFGHVCPEWLVRRGRPMCLPLIVRIHGFIALRKLA
jgi:hypothetical protein